ncbi:MAG TPA: carboxymuconolactone decarboxylase family protein [Acidimicrobiales bacterium]|jgi:alkylhydroperoxidase family enzyme|nr:carboxymuconolactone decarboxylase family protein [Acidimicrobiales bacterium]
MAELSVFRILLQHPPAAVALNEMLNTLLWHGRLDARLRELIIMRIGWSTDSVYEWTQHWRVARQLGVDHDDLLAVRDWERSDRFGAPERAILAATDETLAQGTISDDTWRKCAEAIGDIDSLVELVIVIGNWRLFSSLLRSLEVPLEDGIDPWPPDGRSPSSTPSAT